MQHLRERNRPSTPTTDVGTLSREDASGSDPSCCEWTRLGEEHFRCEVPVGGAAAVHLRPLVEFVQAATELGCEVRVCVGEREADGRSILEILSIASAIQSSLMLETRGSRCPAGDPAVGPFALCLFGGADGACCRCCPWS